MKRIPFSRKFQLTLFVIAMGLSGCCQNMATHRDTPGEAVPLMLKIADVRQANSYTCGHRAQPFGVDVWLSSIYESTILLHTSFGYHLT